MIGLVLAAALSSAPAQPIASDPPGLVRKAGPQQTLPRQSEPMPNLFSQPDWCPSVVEHEIARQKTAFHGQVPPAQYAVLRQIEGCGVPTPIGYHPGYLLPGAADSGAKPEGAPPNRR
jgi:hypothetical protein